MQDYFDERGERGMRAAVLDGGIKGWVRAGPEYTAMVEGYDAAFWAAAAEEGA